MPDVPQYDLITLGETLLRLSPPGMQRFDQARLFETGIGGSELNVGCEDLAAFHADTVGRLLR